MTNRNNKIKSCAIVIPFIFIGFSIFLSISLFLENNYRSMIGWIILTAFFIFIACWAFLSRRTIKPIEDASKSKFVLNKSIGQHSHNEEELTQIISTKDPTSVKVIQDALVENNIYCFIADQHSNELLSFLPDVEMRIMVPQKDYEKSMLVIESLEEAALDKEES